MEKIIITIILFSIFIGTVFPQNTNQPKPTAPPKQPAAPATPVVPGAPKNNEFPVFPRIPSFPDFPNRDNQSNGNVSAVERYNLTVTEAFPNGNTGNNVANTINSAEYILYSNKTIMIKLLFNSGSEYIYHLRNPESKTEIRAGVFRETFETTVQVDKKFLLEKYLSELSYDNNTITSLLLLGNNRAIVLLNFLRRT
jgi:hypothetical protein